jgi:hypothetical protein
LIWRVAGNITAVCSNAGTIMPVFFFPNEVFTVCPTPPLEGQYIIKNLVIISAAIVLGATVRGGAIVADPQALRRSESKVKQ